MEPIDIFEQQMKIEKAELESLTRPVRWIIEIYEFFRYRFIPRITEAPREIKWKLQRLFRGYSDADVWGLNYFIIEKIRPALKAFVKYQEEQGHSLPMDFANNPAAWLVVLKKIEYAFDYVWKDQNDVSS